MKKSTQFIVLTYAISWIIASLAILFWVREAKGVTYTIFASAYMLLPAICSLVLQAAHKEKPFTNLNISFRFNRWFLVAGVIPILYSFFALGINLLFPNISFSSSYDGLFSILPEQQAKIAVQHFSQFPPIAFIFVQTISAILAGYTINAVFAFGEELGWRGYLLRELQSKKLLSVSLIIGLVWGLWHFPLILIGHNYPQHRITGVVMMILFCILLSPVMTYIVIKSKSVITAAIFHGTNNAIARIGLLYVVGGNDLTNGVTGIAGFIAILLVNLGFYLYDKHITKENIFAKRIDNYL